MHKAKTAVLGIEKGNLAMEGKKRKREEEPSTSTEIGSKMERTMDGEKEENCGFKTTFYIMWCIWITRIGGGW
mgnify:CR=1 FL=1